MRDKNAKTLINQQLVKEMQESRKRSSVFGIVCSATPEVRNLRLYGTKESARKHLKALADERRHNLGVHWHEETEDMFYYTLGWEEHAVRFSIIEINVEE
jgi:hypothetical protein